MSFVKSLKVCARMLARYPGMTAISVLALALGIGLTTTMFSIVYGVLLKGLPFDEADRILMLGRNNLSEGIDEMDVSPHDYVDWAAEQRSFEPFAAFYDGTVNLTGIGPRAERFDGAYVTANAFPLMRVVPQLGRGFTAADDVPGAPWVAVIGDALWRNRFNADPAIIGRAIRVNGRVATIVGVMPPRFAFPENEEVWLPLQSNPGKLPRGQGQGLTVLGRLRHGVSMEQARAEMSAIAGRLATQYPATNKGVDATVDPFIDRYIGEEPRSLLYTMLGAVFGVLLIACANVANLLLSRAAVRTKEVAIRAALGARRWQMIALLLLESLLLAVIGAIGGILIGWAGVTWFNRALIDVRPPFFIDIALHPPVLLFVLGITVLAGLAAGVAPALQASRANVNEILKDETRGSSSLRIGRLTRALVVAEIALSCGLLVGAGLMIKSVVRLKTFDFPFHTTDIFTARIGLFESDYPDASSQRRFAEMLLTRLRGRPGLRAVALSSSLPSTGSGRTNFAIDGRHYATDRDYPSARTSTISPQFFETFGLRIVQGRDFTDADTDGAPAVAIVSQGFATRYFPGDNPLGRRLRTGRSNSTDAWMTIVGVVPDGYVFGDLDGQDKDPPGFYVPIAQRPIRFLSLAIRTEGPPLDIAPLVREHVAGMDPNLPIYFVRDMPGVIYQNTWFYGVFGTLFMAFGFVALFLASVGLYGVMSFSVARRTQEIGIRMALGAHGRDVLHLVLRQGTIQLAVGLVLGLGLAVFLSRGLVVLLFEVAPWDPAIFVTIAVVLVVTGLTACLVPARRASRIDPMIALHYE